MPIEMKRSEAKAAIRAAILAKLEGELGDGNRLDGIEGVHDGERIRVAVDLPALFLVREDETVTQHRIHETNDYQLSIVALVAHDDPSLGLDEAESWVDEAIGIVTAERRGLGLQFVNDVKYVRGVPVSAPHTGGRKVGSVGVFTVTYTIVPQ